MMQRRTFLALLGLGLLPALRPASAQGPALVPRIGYLGPVSSTGFPPFVEGLRALGYIPGHNIIIETGVLELDRHAQDLDNARRLIAVGIDVIVPASPYAIEAAAGATRTVPIVGVDFESDPIAKGWVANFAHPGGNVTGIFLDFPEISGKQLQFLKELKPTLSRVAVLGDPRVNELQFAATEAAARRTGLTIQPLRVGSVDEILKAIAAGTRDRADALLALTCPLVRLNLHRVADAALKYRLPAICPFVPSFAEAGGLLAYGPDFPDLFRRAAGYVDRILKGTRPGELPVQRPEKFAMVVNLKTARALKLTLSKSLVAHADQVIQ